MELVSCVEDNRVVEPVTAPSWRNTSLLPENVEEVEVIEYDDTVLINRTSGAVPLAVLNVHPLISSVPEESAPVKTIVSPDDIPVNTVFVRVTVNDENAPVMERPANVDEMNSSAKGDELIVTAEELTQFE